MRYISKYIYICHQILSLIVCWISSASGKTLLGITCNITTVIPQALVPDLTVYKSSLRNAPSTCEPDMQIWHRMGKDLYLHSAWLYVALANEEELTAVDLVVMDIRIGSDLPPSSPN